MEKPVKWIDIDYVYVYKNCFNNYDFCLDVRKESQVKDNAFKVGIIL